MALQFADMHVWRHVARCRCVDVLRGRNVTYCSITACGDMWRVVGVLTFFEEEMLRIAQLLREMLSRRPSREELQRRGIYKGTNFTQLKLNEMRQ